MIEGDDLMELVALIREAKQILVFTGAGISTGSGIPDFRGPQGVWKDRQPVYYQDFMSSEKARIEHWDFKAEGWEGFKKAEPTAAHRAIELLEKAGKLLLVVTQNIDGLHNKGGDTPGKVIELHGTNLEVECQTCKKRFDPDPWYQFFNQTHKPPHCPDCDGFLKPATISFGQNLRQADMEAAEQAALKADLVIALGSTLSVYPAAAIPLIAAQRDVPYVIINQGDTAHDDLSWLTLRFESDVNQIFPAAVRYALNK